jgi:isoleucyl-tRNA synthetase
LLLWNVYNFFVTYANVDQFKLETRNSKLETNNILDQWIVSRLLQLIKVVTESLENYDASRASQELLYFIGDLSTWYVRRSRTRLGPTAKNTQDKQACYQTLHFVLVNFSKILAPINPFIADEIYTNLTGEESVHLTDWPSSNPPPSQGGARGGSQIIGEEVITNMYLVRQIVERGHAARKEVGINVRQPLSKLTIISTLSPSSALSSQYAQLILDELNIKEIAWKKNKTGELSVKLDTTLTPKLKSEGQAREIIRQIQIARKDVGCQLTEYITVTLPDWPKEFEDEIKKQTLAKKLEKGSKLQISRSG